MGSEPEQEHFRPGTVPTLFRNVYADRRTGLLRLVEGTESCSLRFVKGSVVYGASSSPEFHLGRVLLDAGLVDTAELQSANKLVVEQRKRLGEALVEIGAMEPLQLERALALHVRTVLSRVLTWRDGFYTFDGQEPERVAAYDKPLQISTGQLLLEASRQVEDIAAVRFGLGATDCIVLRSTHPLLRFQHVALTPMEGFVLSRLDATQTAEEVVAETPLPGEEVERALFALLCCGLVEYADASPLIDTRQTAQILRQEILDLYVSLNDKNHFELLGLPEDASDGQVQAAYMQRAKRFHPDNHHGAGLEDLTDKLESIFFRLTRAFEALEDAPLRLDYLTRLRPALSKPTPPPPPSIARTPQTSSGPMRTPPAPEHLTTPEPAPAGPTLDPQRAEEVFTQGRERFEEGKYWEAIGLMSVAVTLAEGHMQRRARVLMARCYLKYPDKVKDAEKQLRLVVDQDPRNVDAFYYLGTLYRHGGLSARARAMFQKVLELKPRHREAAAELEHLSGGDGAKKTLFSRD
jgi:tetratricopeptide (TPR) repeat protein